MITKFKLYESNDEIKSVLDDLNKYKSYSPYHDVDFGWVSTIKPDDIKDSDISDQIVEYIKWKYNFDDENVITIRTIHTPMLYDDLSVYTDVKELLFIQFYTDKFANSKHTITKKDFKEFNDFRKNPGMFRETEKYNI